VLDGVKARAFGEHPAREDALHLPRQLDLVHLHEGRVVRRLGRRARVADARRHFQRAELHRLIDGDLQMRDPTGDLVERGKGRDRVLNLIGKGLARDGRAQHAGQ
jgi:hypothetical protein